MVPPSCDEASCQHQPLWHTASVLVLGSGCPVLEADGKEPMSRMQGKEEDKGIRSAYRSLCEGEGPGMPDVCMLSLLHATAGGHCTGFPQRLVVSRNMAATISYGCSSVWVAKGCFQGSSPPSMAPAWSLRSELLIRRGSSFGPMDPKDHWDLRCLRCH